MFLKLGQLCNVYPELWSSGRGSEVVICVPPPQTPDCSPDSVQPASAGGTTSATAQCPWPSVDLIYIYIYAYPHACLHIYISPSLPPGEEQLVKGKLSLGPLVLWCLCGYGLVCAVPCLLNLALLPKILQCTLSPKCLQ